MCFRMNHLCLFHFCVCLFSVISHSCFWYFHLSMNHLSPCHFPQFHLSTCHRIIFPLVRMSFWCLSASHHSLYVCSYESFSCKCFSYVCVSCMSACLLVHFHTCPYSCVSFTCLYDYTFHCFIHFYLSFSFFVHVTFHLYVNLVHSCHVYKCQMT